jgi:hypothetical protein
MDAVLIGDHSVIAIERADRLGKEFVVKQAMRTEHQAGSSTPRGRGASSSATYSATQ